MKTFITISTLTRCIRSGLKRDLRAVVIHYLETIVWKRKRKKHEAKIST